MKGSQCVQVNNYGLLQLISCDLLSPAHGVISFDLYGAGLTNGYIKWDIYYNQYTECLVIDEHLK